MKYQPRGFIAIVTVIALLAFSVSLLTAVTYLSIGGAQSGLAQSQGATALALTEGCVEDALLLGKRDENYNGGTVTYLGGTCVVSVSKNGPIWTLDVSGTRDHFTRSVRVIFSYVPGTPATLTLVSWLEQ